MMSGNQPPRPNSIATPAQGTTEGSYVDWAAILAGSVFALAISFLLISFGSGLGLSLTSPYRGEGMSATWFVIAAGIWFAWVMVTGFGAGGYLAGRMRRRAGDATPAEVEVRDGTHGLMVWATGALVSAILAAAGLGGLVSAGASVAGSAAESAIDAATDIASSDYFANVMLRNAVNAPGATQAAAEGTPPPGAATALDTAAPQQDAARRQPVAAGTDPAVQQQVAAIILRSAASGEMVERDRAYLARLVAANTDLDEDAARARVDEVNAEIAAARAAALAAVERARVAGVILGFVAAATLLVGAVAAFLAAALGGRHRDEGLGFDAIVGRR